MQNIFSVHTDLGSLIGNFDCWYFTMHMWKFSNFSATFILHEINFGWFQRVKNWRFNNFEGFEFQFLEQFQNRICQKLPQFKILSCSNGQNGSFLGLKMTKIDFTWKTEWQKSSEISTLCILILAAQVCTLRNCKQNTISNAWFYYIFRILVVV